jgi:hypothetical protein
MTLSPRSLQLLHSFGLALLTGALSYASGALALGVSKPHFWHDMLVGTLAAAGSRGLGALLNRIQETSTTGGAP